MEGFSLDCGKVLVGGGGGSCWPFDPVSGDVLLMPHAPRKSIICEHEDKFNSVDYPSLTLTSLTSLSPYSDDLNNNSSSLSNDIPILTSNSSFLTLDPLIVGHVISDDLNLRLPKFHEIHHLKKENIDEESSGHSDGLSGGQKCEASGHFEFDPEVHALSSSGGRSPCNDSSTSGNLYFSIQDLTNSYCSSAPTTSTSSFIEIQNQDEDGSGSGGSTGRCNSFMAELGEFESEEGSRTLIDAEDVDEMDADLIEEEEEEDDDVFDDHVVCAKLVGNPGDEEEEEVEGGKAELKCKFCGFVCCSKSSLGIHERRHTGERPYSCKHCGRLFNSAQCCKHHERLHTGDKPFECQYCGKKYAVSTRLKRHERVHTREEPYKCLEAGCGKTFRWFDAFRDHRNTHNGVALYLCSVCGKSFTSYLKFYYHERGHFLKRERERDKKSKVNQPSTIVANKAKSEVKAPKVPKAPRKQRAKKNI